MNRRFYRRGWVGVDALATLRRVAEAHADAAVVWFDAPALRRVALRATRIAATERCRRQHLHDELFGAVRFDAGWRTTVDEGLPPAALEVEAPMRGPFALMRRWPAMRLANVIGGHLGLGLRPGWAPAASPAPRHGAGRRRGRATQRPGRGCRFSALWLAAPCAGFALQPIAARTVLLRQRAGDGWFAAQRRRRSPTCSASWRSARARPPGDPACCFGSEPRPRRGWRRRADRWPTTSCAEHSRGVASTHTVDEVAIRPHPVQVESAASFMPLCTERLPPID